MIKIDLDIGPLLEMRQALGPKLDAGMRDAIKHLALQTHARIIENAQKKLHSTRQKFIEALNFTEVDEDTWIVSLNRSALWIEEGIPANTNMLDSLLRSKKAKTSKTGSRYVVVPFEHKKGPTQATPAQLSLTQVIRQELKERGIQYGGIEKDASGKARTGLLHSFDINTKPIKSHEGPGQGVGPVGKVRQGHTATPFLQGVRIYQTAMKVAGGKEKVKKSIVTFRVASSTQRGKGMWIHPGLEAKLFLDEAAAWAQREFETKIQGEILNSVVSKF